MRKGQETTAELASRFEVHLYQQIGQLKVEQDILESSRSSGKSLLMP
ncbi:hypothetical protein ACFLWS_04080 [Chloroflexota bacterium]